jgi:hypothetical protein
MITQKKNHLILAMRNFSANPIFHPKLTMMLRQHYYHYYCPSLPNLTTSQISKLAKPNPRHNPNQQDQSSDNHRPKLNLQHILIVIRLRSQRNRDQHRQQDHIPADAVVLVQLLRILHPAVQRGHKVLRDADDRLDEDQDVGDEAEDGVRRDKVRAAVADLVVFDHDEAGEGGEEGDVVEGGVRVGALFLLRGCVGRLDDEDALDEEEEGGGVEERVGREEDHIMAEDASPYDRCELCSSVSCCVFAV